MTTVSNNLKGKWSLLEVCRKSNYNKIIQSLKKLTYYQLLNSLAREIIFLEQQKE